LSAHTISLRMTYFIPVEHSKIKNFTEWSRH
jgi:hypothetical protein